MGEVAFVLHTHLPYVREHGVWPVGEEWLFQAWGESWLPVTEVLLRLAEEGHRDLLTLGVTPPVAHQLADGRLRRDLGTWLAAQMWQSEEQRTSYEGRHRAAIRELASFHWKRFAGLLDLHERVEAAGGLLAVWADLERSGTIELLGGPATHPYLPLMDDPSMIDAQLTAGVSEHERWTGHRPRGLWAPECGYRPRGAVGDPTAEPLSVDEHGTPQLPRRGPELPGLEEHYSAHALTHVVVDTATVVRAAGGTDRDWTQRPPPPDPTQPGPEEVVYDGVLIGDSDVVAFTRDLAVAYHVWSPHSGYPGDPYYRDFHARGGFGAHPSWRITDKGVPVEEKAPYEPERAVQRVASHADHFLGVLTEVLQPRAGGLVVAAYDTELFGHWWLEGPAWLESTLRQVALSAAVETTTLRSRLQRRPPTRRLHLPESSWGYAKGHASWVSPETRPMWRDLRVGEARLRRVLARHAPTGAVEGALLQAARELACAQASDWPFMVTRGDCPGYARDRLHGHLEALDQLCDAIEEGADATSITAMTADRYRRVDAPSDAAAFVDLGRSVQAHR